MANIAEGFDSQSNQVFLQFLTYAVRSATEVQSHLYVALDQGYVTKDTFDNLYKQAEKTKSIICGLMRYLRTNPKP
ncbi:MAG: four helix bundle protein [Bacillota bacterium]